MRNSCKLSAASSWWLIVTLCGVAAAVTSPTTTLPTSTSSSSTSASPTKVPGETQEAQAQEQVAILKQINRVNTDGSYTYGYEAADGSFKIETRDVQGVVKGMFGFIDETGQVKRVTYSASNHTGFQAGPTTSASPSPIYRQPLPTVTPTPIYVTTSNSIQSIARDHVTFPSSIQSIPRVTLPRHRRPQLSSSTTARPEGTRRPILFLRGQPQVTEVPEENTRTVVTSTQEPVLVRKVLVNRRPVVIDRPETSTYTSKATEDIPNKSGSHQGNSLRRQLGPDRGGYGGISPQLVRLRQSGGTDDSGDVYGGGGLTRPIPSGPYRGGYNNPTQPRAVQEAILQGQVPGYVGTQRVPLGNFNNLDPRIQARILNSVDPRIQARILNSLDPSVREEIFRAAAADMKVPYGIQNPGDPRNPSDPRIVQDSVNREIYAREEARLRAAQNARLPYNGQPVEDPRNVVGSEDPRIRGGVNGVDGRTPAGYVRVPVRVASANGSDPENVQNFLNQQDPRLGGGYQQDPRYISGYPQDPRQRGGYIQDPRYSQNVRYRGGYAQDPRLGGVNPQDPRIGGSYFQDPRFGGSYNQDQRSNNGYAQDPRYEQEDMGLRIPLNPRLPFGTSRLRPETQQDYTFMQQLLQVLLLRQQQHRLQQQRIQQQYRLRVPTLSPYQQALLATLEPDAPEILEQMMNQLRIGAQQFPQTYPQDDQGYQQMYPDPQGANYPAQGGGAYDQRAYQRYQTPATYPRRFRYRPRYMPVPSYQDGDAVQYYQGPQGLTNYQTQEEEDTGYQQPQNYARPTPYPPGYTGQQEAYPGQQGTMNNYMDLTPEYREAILFRMVLASRARAQQYQDQQQSIIENSIRSVPSVTSTTTAIPIRDSRTSTQVRNVQILDPSQAKRSTTSNEAVKTKN